MATVTAPTNIERLYLAGEWVETGDSFEVRSPHSGEVVATIARAGADEARRAIDAAERAMREPLPPWQRAEILERISQLLRERPDELARTICAEAGKPHQGRACRGVACRQHLRARGGRGAAAHGRVGARFAAPSPATAMRPGRCASQSASSARSRRSTSRSTSLRTSSRPRSLLDARRLQAREPDADLRAAPRGALRRGGSARRVAERPARTRGRRRRRARRRSARSHAHLHGIGRGGLGHPLPRAAQEGRRSSSEMLLR